MTFIRIILLTSLILITNVDVYAQTNRRSDNVIRYTPDSTTILYRIGETIIPIRVMRYGSAKEKVYLNLHSDELSSINATKTHLEREGGYFIRIINNGKRNIKFKLRGKFYAFDPNRIFSKVGIQESLKQLSRVNTLAVIEVLKFADRVLQLFPAKPTCVIALHNNTDGQFGVNSYLPGAPRQLDARAVFLDSLQDTDDIFITTDSVLYYRLAGERFNIILQDNNRVERDGSLSVYCGERNIRYLNCETQHGKDEQYLSMITVASEHIAAMQNVQTFNYRIETDSESIELPMQVPVYFEGDKVGTLRYLSERPGAPAVTGIIDFNRNFSLHSNMNFFLAKKIADNFRIDIRTSRTEVGRILNRFKDRLVIIDQTKQDSVVNTATPASR